MSVFRDMARDAGFRGEELDIAAAQIEQDERYRREQQEYESAACPECGLHLLDPYCICAET